jgi:hypothetical protein
MQALSISHKSPAMHPDFFARVPDDAVKLHETCWPGLLPQPLPFAQYSFSRIVSAPGRYRNQKIMLQKSTFIIRYWKFLNIEYTNT